MTEPDRVGLVVEGPWTGAKVCSVAMVFQVLFLELGWHPGWIIVDGKFAGKHVTIPLRHVRPIKEPTIA